MQHERDLTARFDALPSATTGHAPRMDLEASRKRSLATVRRTIRKVEHVIAANVELAREHPDRRASAEQRIQEGHLELATLHDEERKLAEGQPGS